MDYYTYNLPCNAFTISCSNEVPAHFTCTGTSDGFEVRIAHEYAGVFGLGERYDAVNYIGRTAVNAVEEKFCRQGDKTYCPMPFFWTDTGLGVYAETARVTRFDFAPGAITLHLPAKCALHVFAGLPGEIVSAYMRLTGEAKLPPKWAFGPWISANHWDSREKLEHAVAEAQAYGFPVSVAVIEAWSDEATFYRFRSDELWPRPEEMIERLHEKGVHLILWQIPVYKQLEGHEAPNEQLERDWREAVERGLCVKNADGTSYRIPNGHWFAGSMVPDFTNPETVESWFGKRAYLTDLGVDGFKTDGGEFILSDDVQFFDGTTGAEGRNLYPQMYTGAYTEQLKPGQALFSRAGYVGAHTTPMLWAGDQLSTFDELRSQLNAGLSSAASGVIFWGFDIGGFAGELPSPELYLRATQLACFAPIMQWHSEPDGGQFKLLQPGMEGNNERSPWNIERAFGLSGYTEKIRFWHCLRMELQPYIWTEAIKCVDNSKPLMRPLAYEFPNVCRAVSCSDEYMFGDALLIAPVLCEGAEGREAYLPEGEWYGLFDGAKYAGGQSLYCDCGESMPVFVRVGAALPLDVAGTLRFLLCGDNGSYNYRDNSGSNLTITWTQDEMRAEGECERPFELARFGAIGDFLMQL